MNSQIPARSYNLQGRVEDLFELQAKLGSSMQGDVWRGLERSTRRPCLVALGRKSIDLQSPLGLRFGDRCSRLLGVHPAIADIGVTGVDALGVPIVATYGSDVTLGAAAVSLSEAERRFLSLVRLVERMHKNGVVLGDGAPSASAVDRSGNLLLVGLLGPISTTEELGARVEYLPYVSPAVAAGAEWSIADDIYSLGVLAYFLFSGRYPHTPSSLAEVKDSVLSQFSPVGSAQTRVPFWVDEVVVACCGDNPPSHAGEIITIIENVRTAGAGQSALVAAAASKSRSLATRSTGPAGAEQAIPKEGKSGARLNTKFIPVVGGILGLGALAVLAGVWLFSEPGTPVVEEVVAPKFDPAGNAGLEEALRNNPQESPQQKFQKLSASDDPIAHAELINEARIAQDPLTRSFAEAALLERSRRLGLTRTPSIVERWLNGNRGSAASMPIYGDVLRLLDRGLPMEGVEESLRKIFEFNALLSLRLTAALGLDTEKYAEYQKLTGEELQKMLKLDDAPQQSFLAHILVHPDLTSVFGDFALGKKDELSNSDISWLMAQTSYRNDVVTDTVRDLAAARGLISGVRKIFLEVARDNPALNSQLALAITRASSGSYSAEDINTFGAWASTEAEKLILATAVESSDSSLRETIFDTLASKPLTMPPTDKMIRWVRDNRPELRGRLVRPIAIIAFFDKVPAETLREAFEGLQSVIEGTPILEYIIQADNPVLTSLVLDLYSKNIRIGGLLNLLRNKDREVRMRAVKLLHGNNDIGVSRIVLDAYEKEKDEAIRAEYKESFWFIKERGPR